MSHAKIAALTPTQIETLIVRNERNLACYERLAKLGKDYSFEIRDTQSTLRILRAYRA